MRALEPTTSGYAVNSADSVRLFYELYEPAGHTAPALLLVPPFQIVHSRMWKMQIPFLAEHFRTLLYDPRGNGKSDRPADAYSIDALVGDALAVLDATGTERCGLVTVSSGSQTCLYLA